MNWFFLANASTNRIWTPKLHEEFRKHTEINASIWLLTGLNAKKKNKNMFLDQEPNPQKHSRKIHDLITWNQLYIN